MVCELLGCGFNAHGQLSYGCKESSDEDPVDIGSPVTIASADSFRILFAGWSNTLLDMDSELQLRGVLSSHIPMRNVCPKTTVEPRSIKQAFGDHCGLKGILTTTGEVLRLSFESTGSPMWMKESELGIVDFVAIAGNGRVCVVREGNRIISYRSLEAFFTKDDPERSWSIITSGIRQLDANECSFVLLTAEGEILTWGDARYGLGRDVTLNQPAESPCILSALEGLVITKISCGGFVSAAISKDRDLYAWGTMNSGNEILQFLPKSLEEVELVDMGEDVDVIDVAVGGGHICVLSSQGDVYTAGRNHNGQLGCYTEGDFYGVWQKWRKTWIGTAVSVFSGPFSWNTFCCVVPTPNLL